MNTSEASGSTKELETLDLYEGDEKDRAYQTKVRILNHAVQEIGMGKYQVRDRSSIHAFFRSDKDFILPDVIVVPLRDCWFRLVFVRLSMTLLVAP